MSSLVPHLSSPRSRARDAGGCSAPWRHNAASAPCAPPALSSAPPLAWSGACGWLGTRVQWEVVRQVRRGRLRRLLEATWWPLQMPTGLLKQRLCRPPQRPALPPAEARWRSRCPLCRSAGGRVTTPLRDWKGRWKCAVAVPSPLPYGKKEDASKKKKKRALSSRASCSGLPSWSERLVLA